MPKIRYLIPFLALMLTIGVASAQPTLPSGTVNYTNITIGSWSSVNSTYIQQMVNITENTTINASINYNNSTANFEYSYTNGTIIPAWIESNNSGVITTWLNITNATTQVELDFLNQSTNTLSNSSTTGIGEATQSRDLFLKTYYRKEILSLRRHTAHKCL